MAIPRLTAEDLPLRDTKTLIQGALYRADSGPTPFLQFLLSYSSWNGFFGPSVALLSGMVGASRHLFVDPKEPNAFLSDRSVLVASHIFDAARDEFDDRDTQHRDTHRCLSQATLAATMDFYSSRDLKFEPPMWLRGLNDHVAIGYGYGSPRDYPSIFRAIGFHLGSEILADSEFTMIDTALQRHAPKLLEHLKRSHIEISGQKHNAYSWIRIHSGHGGGVEADHFEAALQAARLAFKFAPEHLHRDLLEQIHIGFNDFARDHELFFTHV